MQLGSLRLTISDVVASARGGTEFRARVRGAERVADGIYRASGVHTNHCPVGVGKLVQVAMDKGTGGLNDAGFVDWALVLVGPDVEWVTVLVEIGIYQYWLVWR